MSDPGHAPLEVSEAQAPEPRPAGVSPWRGVALALAGALLLVVVLVATAPLWTGQLPWEAPQRSDSTFGDKLDRLAAEQSEARQQARQAAADTSAALQRLQQAGAQTGAALQGVQQAAAQTGAAVQRLDQRVATLEARPAQIDTGDLADIRKQLAALSTAAGDLATRVDAIDKAVHTQTAHDTTDAALALTVLQLRNAVETGRPFAAEYDTLSALARPHADIAQATARLAEPAKSGVASRQVLAQGLRRLARADITQTAPSAAKSGWRQQVLARLNGLVKIRRLDGGEDGATSNGPKGAVNAAEGALAGGDLAGAIAALDKLTGAPAEAAGPWLRMARQRLAVDNALERIEALLTAQLGNGAAASRPPG